MSKFKRSRKRGYCKSYQPIKYKSRKSYISPTTTTTQPNNNINIDNRICGEIEISYRNICDDINSNNCAQNIDRNVATITITNSINTTNTTKNQQQQQKQYPKQQHQQQQQKQQQQPHQQHQQPKEPHKQH